MEDLISQKELCEKMRVSRYMIYRAIKAGEIHPVAHPEKGTHENWFRVDEINEWFKRSVR